MATEPIIEAKNVSKKYCKSLRRSMLYGMVDITKNLAGLKSQSSQLRPDEFWSVDDVSFSLRPGGTLGIIGPNGSGKTTLLKMLNGIFWPDRGKITIRGRVGALIEVGAGFHPMLTGRENIYINGAILGMTKAEVKQQFDSIVAFADIGTFLDVPVKHYSSGMFVRLGFAVAVHCQPDILLIDEVLAVGDASFHAKCLAKISELRQSGTAIVMVSHDLTFVQMICEETLFLDHSKLCYLGPTSKAITHYYDSIKNPVEIRPSMKGDQSIQVRKFEILDQNLRALQKVQSGAQVTFRWSFRMKDPIINPVLHFSLSHDTYHGYSTKYDDFILEKIDDKMVVSLSINHLGLAPGTYTVSLGIWDSDFVGSYFWDHQSFVIHVEGNKPMMGRFAFEHQWHVTHS